MRKHTNYTFILLFILRSAVLHAQYHTDPIPALDSLNIYSNTLGEMRRINVWVPPAYHAHADPLPVLYMPDGGIKEDFPHIANTLAALIEAKKIEPIMLVGIENTQRRRDLTGPTEVKKDKKIAPVVGGSAAFRSFIIDELFPEINKRYRTKATKGIIGESLAGLFVAETFLLHPEDFDFYIAFDPSLWWNDMDLVKHADQYIDPALHTPKTLWFASSDAKDIYRATGSLAEILQEKNIKALHWTYVPKPEEQHSTIFRAAKEEAIVWTLNHLPEE